jgi:hypothetical protein
MPLSYDDLVPKKKTGYGDLIPEGSTTEDVVKSAAIGVPRGVANTIGSQRDSANFAADVLEFLAAKAGGLAGVPEEKFYGKGRQAVNYMPYYGSLPSTEDLRRDVVDPYLNYTPKTELGKRAEGVSEVASGTIAGGGGVVPGLLSGVGAEGMGFLFNDNPWMKMLGAFMAPATAGTVNAYRSTPGQMLRQATGELTPQQILEAKAKLQQGQQQGINLMAPEVLPPSGIQPLAADVASSQAGGRVINDFMSKRPGQVKQAVNTQLDQIAPATTPDASMATARDAATNVIRSEERARTAAVKPDYQAARRDIVPPENVQAIVDQIDNALPHMSPESKAAALEFKRSLENTNPTAAALDDLYKTTRNKIDLPPIGATPEQKTTAGVLGPFNATLDDGLKLASDNIKRGRDKYRQITEDVIDPLTAGPVGRVAGKQGFDPSMPEGLNPISAIANEKIARPESIRELYSQLNKQNPKAFPGMARTWLENSLDQSAQKIQAGENRMVGANFAKSVYGTPQQEANFSEIMRGVAVSHGKSPQDAEQFAKGAKNLIETLQLTGKVPAVGSPTGGRIAANEMAASSAPASVAESLSAIPFSGVARKLRQWAMQDNYKALAEAMTAPDSIDRIVAMGKYNPKTATAQYYAASVLGLITESGR